MANLKTQYLGLQLKNPFIVSSCGLTGSLGGIKACAEHGAAAIVLKSLFEEQIDVETGLQADAAASLAQQPDAAEYLTELGKSHGPDKYLALIRAAKEMVDIPIIASVNCISDRWWTDFTRQLATSGADALELNIGRIPTMAAEDAAMIEQEACEIVRTIKHQLQIPVTVKIGPHYTSLPALVDGLIAAGADGIVLFNRFFQIDIDTETQSFITGKMISSPAELALPLRWTALLASRIKVPISLSTGVHSADDAIKAILAGASVVQIASVLYEKKVPYLETMLAETNAWLDQHGAASLDAIRGNLSAKSPEAQAALGRTQYIKALTGIG